MSGPRNLLDEVRNGERGFSQFTVVSLVVVVLIVVVVIVFLSQMLVERDAFTSNLVPGTSSLKEQREIDKLWEQDSCAAPQFAVGIREIQGMVPESGILGSAHFQHSVGGSSNCIAPKPLR